LLGRRTVGTAGAAVGAAIVTLSPFAIFYSTEARAYATLVFLVTLSTLALLRALDRAGWGWWVVYAAATAGALYTHYTALFVLVAQAVWAFWVHRDRTRTLVIVHAAVVLAYLPWLPSFFEQHGKGSAIDQIGKGQSLSVGTRLDYILRFLVGFPFARLRTVPGLVALVLLGVAAAIAFLATVRGRCGRRPNATQVLVAILAIATPVGIVLYAAVGSNLYIPRNLSASLPALALLVGALFTSLRPRPVAAAAVALVLVAVGIGTVRGLEPARERPAAREVAHFIDARGRPGDPVVSQLGARFLDRAVSLNFKSDHRVFGEATTDDAGIWKPAAHGGSVFLVRHPFGYFVGLPPFAGPHNRYVLREGRKYGGLVKLAVGRYSGQAAGRLGRDARGPFLSWSLGPRLPIAPGLAKGYAESVSASRERPLATGWTTDAAGKRPPTWVLAFYDGRLVAFGRPSVLRVDIAKALGRGAALSGFQLTARTAAAKLVRDPSRLHVYAVVGDRATELPRLPAKR
jgi:hypothetical protein